LTKAEEKQVIDGLKSGHLPDFMTQGTRINKKGIDTGSPEISGGDFSRAERKAGRDPVGTVAIGRDNIYILNAAKQWRKAKGADGVKVLPNSKIASLLLGHRDSVVVQSGKTWTVIYASESKAKDDPEKHGVDTVWLGDVLLPRQIRSHESGGVRLKEIGDSWFHAENKKAIVDLIDRTRSGTSGSRKPKPKPETPSIAIAPKSTGIKMF
jgi:hypothetical protein